MKRIIAALCTIAFILSFFGSCTKEAVAINTPSGRSLLMAHSWQLEEVTEQVSGKYIMVYQRGQSSNADDYSLVRHTFKGDGTLQYVDQFGISATDGEFDLNVENSKTQVRLGTQNLVGEKVTIGTNHLVYTVKLSEEDAVCYKFVPAT